MPGGIKKVVVDQQKLLEKNESDRRKMNVIFSGVSEGKVIAGDDELSTDTEKVHYLINSITTLASEFDAIGVKRLGKYSDSHPRPLCVTFSNIEDKLHVLQAKRKLADQNIRDAFKSGIYINTDRSFLSRKEDQRLYERLKGLRTDYPEKECYIKSRRLYCCGKVLDEFDISNQIF